MSDVISQGAYAGPIGQVGSLLAAFPYTTLPAPTGGFLAGKGGLTIGKFAWIDKDDPTRLTQDQSQASDSKQGGFIIRQAGAVIQGYEQGTNTQIPEAVGVTAIMRGTVYAVANSDVTPGEISVASDGTVTQQDGTALTPPWYADRPAKAGEIFKIYS